MRKNIAAVLMLVTGLGILTFWVLFFKVGMAPEPAPQCYFAFERSFVLPDSLLAICLLGGGLSILGRRKSGRSLALAASGALVFLGLLDFSFNVMNGVYETSSGEFVMNGGINLWCAGFGSALFLIFRENPQG